MSWLAYLFTYLQCVGFEWSLGKMPLMRLHCRRTLVHRRQWRQQTDAGHLWPRLRGWSVQCTVICCETKAPSTPATMSKQRSTLSKQHLTLLPKTARMSNEISSFRQSRNKMNKFNLFRLCRKDEISFDIVAQNGRHCCQERQQYRSNVRLVAFDNVASTLLLVWTRLETNAVWDILESNVSRRVLLCLSRQPLRYGLAHSYCTASNGKMITE